MNAMDGYADLPVGCCVMTIESSHRLQASGLHGLEAQFGAAHLN